MIQIFTFLRESEIKQRTIIWHSHGKNCPSESKLKQDKIEQEKDGLKLAFFFPFSSISYQQREAQLRLHSVTGKPTGH